MARWEHNIPAVPNPLGEICVQVYIPAHPDYVSLFIRAVRQLENNRIYQRDEENGAIVKVVQDQWRNRTVTPLIEALAQSTGLCQDLDGECLAFPPFANFISYYPQNPYTEPDLVPDGFLAPPFFVNGKDAAHDLPNYNKGDVIVNFAAINLEPVWNLDNTPRIELCLEGSGVVELHLLKTVQGGAAVISVDNPIDLGDIISGIIGDGIEIISLNQDIISLPPETAEEVIIEREITTEGEHTLYIYYLPTLDDSLIPLFFGGGLREISLCGNIRPCGMPAPEPPPPLEGVTELKPEFQFTADCGLEYRLRDQEDNIVQDWTAVAGWVDNAALCFGVGAMTEAEICAAIECGAIKVAERIITGQSGIKFSVGEDGEVIVGGGVQDDPETELDESLSSRAGGVKAAVDGLQEVLNAIHGWFAGFTPPSTGVTEQQAATRLELIYGFDSALATHFANYWYTTYANSSGAITLNESVLESMFFCKGLNVNIFAEYVYEVHATAAEIAVLEVFIADFPASQLDVWYARGATVPSTDYLSYSCTKIQTEEFTLDMSSSDAPSYTTNGVWKVNHRYLVEISGSFADADVPNLIGDGVYFHATDTGVKSFDPIIFNFPGGVTAPVQANVPFSASHTYAFTVEKTGSSSAGIIARGNAGMATPNVTGILTIKVTDLGEFAL